MIYAKDMEEVREKISPNTSPKAWSQKHAGIFHKQHRDTSVVRGELKWGVVENKTINSLIL